MNPNIMAEARQAVQGAQAPQAPLPAQAPQPTPSLPTPPPQVALQLAKQALSMPPMVLGTLLWRALGQHGAAVGKLSPHFHGQQAMGGVNG